MTPHGGITPSPRPRGNLTQRVSQRSQRFLRLGHLTPTATLHKDTARLICTIMIVLYVMVVKSYTRSTVQSVKSPHMSIKEMCQDLN